VIMTIGVLALQGDFAAHLEALARERITGVDVRYAVQLRDVDGLIIPGGESTTLLNLISERRLEAPLRDFHARGGALFGTCAGAILLSRTVTHPAQPSFDLIDIDVERNGYGRQKESFETEEVVEAFGEAPVPMIFIRAPRIRRIGPGVEVLASSGGEPVMVRQGLVLAGTFHPELGGDGRPHRYFAAMAAGGVLAPS